MKKFTTSLFLFLFFALTTYAQECVERVVSNIYATTAFLTNGDIYSWGPNENGEVGNNTTEFQDTAVHTVMADSWQDISHGRLHTLALNLDGTIWAWGSNGRGQLGDGTTDDRLSPVQLGTDTDWVAISAGSAHSVALKSDGTMWGWGNNAAFELENSNTQILHTPFQLGADTGWAQIEANFGRTFGIKTDGTLWGRGRNQDGTLGIQSSLAFFVNEFTQVGTDTTWTKIGGGQFHTLASKSDSTLWSWGRGKSIGQGTLAEIWLPTQIGNDQWKYFSTANYQSLGVKMDGTLWEWGEAFWYAPSGSSELYPERLSPVQVETDADWESVAVGSSQFIAIKEDHTLWMWGYNGGQFGDGTTASHFDPVLVMDCPSAPVNTANYELEQTTFYPNPVQDVMEWTNNTEFATYHITNMLGQTVRSGNSKGNQLNLSELKTGMYLVIFQTKEGKVVRHKFLKS